MVLGQPFQYRVLIVTHLIFLDQRELFPASVDKDVCICVKSIDLSDNSGHRQKLTPPPPVVAATPPVAPAPRERHAAATVAAQMKSDLICF